MSQAPEPISYASIRDPGQNAVSPWPLVTLVVLALGMIILGGCFCIGILLMIEPSIAADVPTQQNFREEHALFSVLLGLIALLCFVIGFGIVIGLVRRLLKRI